MMNHLIAVYENGLHPQAKLLYGILSAYADADGLAIVEEAHVAEIMQISPARLRAYRSALNGSGYCTIKMSAGKLLFAIGSDRLARESDRPAITDGHGDPQDADPAEESDRPTRESDRLAITDEPSDAPTTSLAEKSDRPTRESDRLAITDEQADGPAMKSDRLARESDRPTRESDRLAITGGDYRGGRLVGNLLSHPSEKSLPTNLPATPDAKSAAAPNPTPNPPAARLQPWEAALSEKLLVALGCQALPLIRAIAASVPFADVRAHALAWQRDTKAQGPGGLLNRIRSGDFAPPPPTEADTRSALFRQFRTPDEIAADRAQRAAEEARREQTARQEQREKAERAAAIAVAGVDIGQAWQDILADLRNSLPPATFDTYLAGSQARSFADGVLTIQPPTALAGQWLTARLLPRLRSAAVNRLGWEATVEIAAMESGR